MKIKRALSLLLLAAVLFGFCACAPEAEPDLTFRGKTSAEYAKVNIGETAVVEHVSSPKDNDVDISTLHLEGEAFDRITMTNEFVTDGDFAENGFLSCVDVVAEDHLDDTFEIVYHVSSPDERPYTPVFLASQFDYSTTTDYVVLINGEEAISKDTLAERGNVRQSKVMKTAKMYTHTFRPVMLKAGENEIVFRFRNDDIREQIRKKYFFYLDTIDFIPVEQTEVKLTVAYAEEPTDEYAYQKSFADDGYVFASKPGLCIDFELFAWTPSCAGNYKLIIRDYDGEAVFMHPLSLCNGSDHYTVTIPEHPTGYYEIDVVNETGGDPEAEEISYFHTAYVVMTDPSERVMYEDSPFALDLATADAWSGDWQYAMRYICMAKLAGVSWVRERTRWMYLEMKEGEYSYWSTDDFYNNIYKAGVKIVTLLNGQPVWLRYDDKKSAEENYIGDNYFVTKQMAFYNLCKMLGERYDGKVHAWEILNEQDWYNFEPQPESSYASFMKAGILGFADSGSSAAKMMGALCQPSKDTGHLQMYEACDLFRFSDAFNYHNHIDTITHAAVTNFIEGVIAPEYSEYGAKVIPEIPTWITEAGIALYTNGQMSKTQEKMQARYLVNSTVQSIAIGTDMHFWFIMRECGDSDAGRYNGYRSSDKTPLPCVAAEAVMTEMLGKGEYVGALKVEDERDEGHVIFNGKDDVLVVWSSREEETKIKTDANVLCTDIMGNSTVLVADKEGYVTLTVSPSEQYLTFDGKAPADLYTPSEIDPAIMVVSKNDFTVGEHVVISQLWPATPLDMARGNGYAVSPSGSELHVYVNNYNDIEVTGTLTFETAGFRVEGGETSVTLAPYETKEIVFTVTPDGASADPQYFTIGGTFNGEATSPCAATVFIG